MDDFFAAADEFLAGDRTGQGMNILIHRNPARLIDSDPAFAVTLRYKYLQIVSLPVQHDTIWLPDHAARVSETGAYGSAVRAAHLCELVRRIQSEFAAEIPVQNNLPDWQVIPS